MGVVQLVVIATSRGLDRIERRPQGPTVGRLVHVRNRRRVIRGVQQLALRLQRRLSIPARGGLGEGHQRLIDVLGGAQGGFAGGWRRRRGRRSRRRGDRRRFHHGGRRSDDRRGRRRGCRHGGYHARGGRRRTHRRSNGRQICATDRGWLIGAGPGAADQQSGQDGWTDRRDQSPHGLSCLQCVGVVEMATSSEG